MLVNVTLTQRGDVVTSTAQGRLFLATRAVGRVTLTVVLTSSIVTVWSVFAGPHVSQRRNQDVTHTRSCHSATHNRRSPAMTPYRAPNCCWAPGSPSACGRLSSSRRMTSTFTCTRKHVYWFSTRAVTHVAHDCHVN